MKSINTVNYTTERYYGRVVATVQILLERHGVVRPIDVLVTLGLLTPQHASDWQAGRIPHLERVIHCNLSKAGRILRILRLYAHDLKLHESTAVYRHRGRRLRFSKTHEPRVEDAYSRHFLPLHHAGSRKFSGGPADHRSAEPAARAGSTL